MPIKTVEHYSLEDGGIEVVHRVWPISRSLNFSKTAWLLGAKLKDLRRLVPEDPRFATINQPLSDMEILRAAAALRRAEIEKIDLAQATAREAKLSFDRPDIKIAMQPDLMRDGIIVTTATPVGINQIVLDIPWSEASKVLEEFTPCREN